MPLQERYKVTPYLALVISLILTLLAIAYEPYRIIFLVSAAGALTISVFLFFRPQPKTPTAQKQGELRRQLKQNQTRLNDLISQVPGIVWEGRLGTNGTLILSFVSDYAEKMLGYSLIDWIATPHFWMTIIHPEDQDR